MSPTWNGASRGRLDPADRAAGHHAADLDGRGIGRAGVHPAPHVGVEREVDRAQEHLPRAGLRHGRLDEPEVGLLRLAVRACRQDDLSIHASGHRWFLPKRQHGRRLGNPRRPPVRRPLAFRLKSDSNPVMIIPVRVAGSLDDFRSGAI